MLHFLNKHYRWVLFLIPVTSLLMHWHVFSKDLIGIHVWRQTQTQIVTNNFVKEDMNILHPQINEFREGGRITMMEFPVMQWLNAVAIKIFGNHIAVSRAFMFLIGLFSVFGMFYLCDRLFKNKAAAVLCAWTFNFSPVFYYYTVNPIPDNFALCCSIWSIGLFYQYLDKGRMLHLLLSALFLCLATLAKLPFVIYGSVAFVALFQFLKRGHNKNVLAVVGIYTLLLIPAAAWYIVAIPTWDNNGVVAGVLDNKLDAAVYFDIIQHHLISALPETLLNYGSVLFFIAGLVLFFRNRKYSESYFPGLLLLSIMTSVYFLFEMNMIAKVHDYYLFPFLPLLFIIVAYGVYHLLNEKNVILKTVTIIALLVLPLTAWLRVNNRWNTASPGFNATYYQYRDELRALMPADAIVVTGNDESHFILLYYLDRTGWAFHNDKLDGSALSYYISEGADYLFVDSDIDQKEDIKPRLNIKIFEKDNLRVYKLK